MKFSLHGWVEGLSGKQRFSKPNNQISFGKKSESSSNASQKDNTGKDCAVREHDSSKATEKASVSIGDGAVQHRLDDVRANATKPTSSSDGDGAINHCLDKCVVSQNNEDLGSSHLIAKNTVDLSHKLVVSQGSSHNDNVLPQIKWGDLDEGTLRHYGKASRAEFEFGGVKNRYLVSVKADGAAECLPCTVPLDPEETKSVRDHCVSESHSSAPRTISVEETDKEVNEVPLEDVKEQITSEKIVIQGTSEHLKPDNEATYDLSGESFACSDNKEIEWVKSANVSIVPLMDSATSSRTIDEPESGESILAASIEGSSNQKSKANSDGLLDAQNADAVTSDDVGESKERFRERLWCFLFENLNRAVDELYLLCELECDLEQMKEASLVLEEAALDFRELNSRVETFEKSKRSSSHDADGGPLVMQSDHRRPHALSWEVSLPARFDSNVLSFRFLIFTYVGLHLLYLIAFNNYEPTTNKLVRKIVY